MSRHKRGRVKPQATVDFRSFDFSEFAAFLQRHASEWLAVKSRRTHKRLSPELLNSRHRSR